MRSRRAILWLCMLALVAAQAIGFMHRIVHAPQVTAALGHAHGGDWVHDLFAVHEDDSTCRLSDASSADGIALSAVVLQSLIPAQTHIALAEAQATARHTDLFQARGPPASSFT